MQAYAEGFDLFDKSRVRPRQGEDRAPVDAGLGRALVAVRARRARVRAGGQRPRRASTAHTDDSGEGRWTIEDAMDKDVPTPVITASLYARFYSRGNGDFTHRMLVGAARAVRRPRRTTTADDRDRGARENPLAEGLERLPVHPTTLVIFGATGDLARRKLLPALYNLAHEGALPERFDLVGVSRGELTDEDFREQAVESVREFSRRAPDEKCSSSCSSDVALRRRAVRRARPSTSASTTALPSVRRGRPGSPLNRCFYLSTAPTFFPVIVEHARRGTACNATTSADVRVVIEKPIGTNLEEARELNRRVLSVFDEHQVFRIDHYLGKETVQNVLAFRFANGHVRAGVEPQLHRPRADHRGRGHRRSARARATTTRSGALRDLVQNHMLQLLTLLCMEPPVNFTADEVRDEKVKVLRAIKMPDARARSRRWRCAAQYARGHRRRRGGPRLPRGGRRPGGLEDRDVRRAAPGGRQLALGRRADVPAHRQAPGAQGHRDRGDAQAGPAPRLRARTARSACGPNTLVLTCSPTRACRCRSARRSPARGCRSAR